MKTDLLIALGAIAMGSVRGSAKSIISYNYDDLLEWYLDFHGYKIQAVSSFPTLLQKSDVCIYHPHGFLPLEKKYADLKTNEVILSQRSYLDSFKQVDPWNEIQIAHLSSHLCLFIGLSGEDDHIEFLCNEAFKRVKQQKERPLIGYMVLLDNVKNREIEDINLNRGLINLYIKDYNGLPNMILDICRKAVI